MLAVAMGRSGLQPLCRLMVLPALSHVRKALESIVVQSRQHFEQQQELWEGEAAGMVGRESWHCVPETHRR